jgi:GT2 family glycosyltransferase/glycosyltransferase involved in cell wall biosynthesis
VSKVEESRLAVLFEEITELAQQRCFAEALKLADNARRFVPNNATAILLHARLLLQVGDARAAEASLRGRGDLDSLTLHAEAALRAGLPMRAASTARALLQTFSVDSLADLRPTVWRLAQAGGGFPGWVGIDSNLRLCGEIPGNCVARIYRGSDCVGELVAESDGDWLGSFFADIATRLAGELHVRVGERELLGSPLQWPPKVDLAGWVMLEGQALQGEVRLNWSPRSAVTLLVGGGPEPQRVRVEPLQAGQTGWRFSIDVNVDTLQGDLVVAALLPDGSRAPLMGSPVKMQAGRPRAQRAQPKSAGLMSVPSLLRPPNVVVPVHSGLEETRNCLRSVLATLPQDAVLTIVHDAGPELEMPALLREFEGDPRVTLVWNATNLGFPGAANRGMRVHRDRDVLLLNADTEVFDGWIERLAAAAYAHEKIGTVTPLGEAASIVSYPGARAPACTSAQAERIDYVARHVNADKLVPIPVGVGFCLYLRRACLDDVGEFDEVSFAKGYGEENDFCLRARGRGWRHVAAPNVFVRHVGGRSFGAAKQALTTRNQRILNQRYPGYDAHIAKFLAKDPLRAAKRAIDQERLLTAARRPVLLLSMTLPGGVRRHVAERRAALEAAGHSVLIMQGSLEEESRGRLTLESSEEDFEFLRFDLPAEITVLQTLLKRLRLQRLEVHHFLGLPPAALELAVSLAVPYEVFIHDYAWICPRISLLNGAGEYCGEPALEACEACIAEHGTAFNEAIGVAELRTRSARILRAAQRIVAPSQDVRRRLLRYVPDVSIEVTPWEEDEAAAARAPRAERSGRVRVLVPGAIGTPKGFAVLTACAQDAAARDLELEFVVIGYTRDDAALRATGRVSLTGPYEEHELPMLLQREDGDVVWLASIMPETWSYTLTQAMRHNLPIAAFDIGAIAERLRQRDGELLLPLGASPSSINDALLRHAASAAPAPVLKNQYIARDEKRMEASENSTSADAQDIAATVQVLTLPVGIYAFTVQSGSKTLPGTLALPALQVAPAPMRSAGTIEFLSGPSTMDRWLTATGDVLTAKVSGAPVAVIMTSLRGPDSDVLSIDIRRLDAPAPVEAPAEPAPQPAAAISGPRIATRVHLPYIGELEFEEGWAGRPQDNLWIESFAAMPAAPNDPDLIEYCGLNEAGETTDWLSSGQLCGKRGAGVPLVAFAARVKGAAAASYTCLYSGQFLSGNVVGPFNDGRLCRSDAAEDPLVALELRLEPIPA